METILYKPLFINPQAYYVFPNINGRLEPKTGSGKEPAIFVGNIEVKTIAHGDIGKKQYFYNTNEIDLSAFSNSLVRISLYTSRGNVVLGEWNLDVVEGESEDYIDPEVLASLVAVCICDGKSNDDPDRAVIKNLVDPDNPFIISNAAFKLNSGFGEYKVDFLDWTINSPFINERTSFTFSSSNDTNNDIITVYQRVPAATQSFKIKAKLRGRVLYRYYVDNGDTISISYYEVKEGINILPDSADPTSVNGKVGFVLKGLSSVKVEQVPSFEGAFVTDGIDDLITSTKTVQEMLGGSSEITVVSMIHQIGLGCRTNFICDKGSYWRCNEVANTGEGKTGIYGYSSTNLSVNTPNIINNVLGDKVDYSVTGDRNDLTPSQFSVVGYISSSGEISYTSSVAWYWTIIANKVLTTDQINQVISYFNLDKSVAYKPYNKVTYIDGIKNESVLVQDLEGITHNITGIYDNLDLSDERDVCISRTSDASNSGFADMSMYEFMLFPDVLNEEEIKELNDIVGIEGNTDDLLIKN